MEGISWCLIANISREVLIYYTGGALPLQTTLAGD